MSFDPDKITYFAKTDARGQQKPFGIKAKDRQRHVYVIGKTGMGKSTLLENMAVQDIKNGEGLAFIDPHGSTAETLLDFIPEERVKDVLYFAPFDMEHPISFNIMEDVGPDKRHLVVSGLMSVFEKIWVDAWSARMAYILQNTLMALLEYPDSTLLGVNRMLSDKKYREKVVDNVKDPGVKSFWVDEFAKYNERYMQEAGDAIKNKIGQFTANPVIRNIIGQPHSSFDIRDIMDNKKILIMNLSKGLIGETNANLLGSMLTTRIYLAAMSRADLSPQEMKEMPNFYFYVDEFQSFANSTFANILSEARKYKLNLTIAHQYVEQMEEEVRNAVFGNVGTVIAFRVGPFDAEVLEAIFAPEFTATDLVNLGFAQIYLTLMIDGIGSRPFSAVTLPPIEAGHTSCKEMVIRSSQKNFGSERTQVEEMVNAFHEQNRTPPKPPKEKKRPTRKPEGGFQPPLRKKEEKDVNDLRNVLKIITKTPGGGQQKKEAPKPPAKKTEDLKAALAGVMKEAPKPEQKHTPPAQKQKVPRQQKKPIPKQKEESVSAKNLERMMRVTTQDKPPMT
ncbi:type IV secretion system DNA-binding domain-containing protein [Candidatus Kaiserbacteria bacterium]|nr:type IV secretion system DNA-binding domain-containing protein [Candidatus Kaiserbacteria bacterium]